MEGVMAASEFEKTRLWRSSGLRWLAQFAC